MTTKTRVLIIEDEESCLKFLRAFFRRHYPDFEVDGAFEGFMGCWKAHRMQPDLIFLDICLPGSDGFHTFHFLKKLPEGNTAHVIAMSGRATEEARKKMLDLGARDFLPKPFSTQLLKEKVDIFLSHRYDQEQAA